MTCNASMKGGRRRSAKRSRSVRRSRSAKRSRSVRRSRGMKRSRSRSMRGGAVATNATALALTQGSTSGTDYVGKLMGSMDTQWKGVFEPTGNLAPYNGNQYVLRNGDSIPTIPTGMNGGKKRGKRR